MTRHRRARPAGTALAAGLLGLAAFAAPAVAVPHPPVDAAVPHPPVDAAASVRPTAPAAARPRRPAANPTDVGLELLAVAPRVAAPGQPVAVRVRVTNRRSAPLTTTVEAGLSRSALRGRQAVDRQSLTPATGLPFAARSASTTVPAGGSAVVALTIPPQAIRPDRPYGALPLTLRAALPAAAGTEPTTAAALGTYLPFQVRKEYEPMRVAVAVPLTLDPDPGLAAATATEAEAAWTRLLGPGSRLRRIVEGTLDAPVTWVVDPAVVGEDALITVSPPGPPTATGTAPTPPTPAPAGSPAASQAAFARLLAGYTPGHAPWRLPPQDPDLSALAEADPGLLSMIVPDETSAPGPRVAWYAGASDATTRSVASSAFGPGGPGATLVPESTADPDPELTGDAARRDRAGRKILAVDDALSSALAEVDRPGSGALVGQRLLADSVALLDESPGRIRNVLLAPPRSFDPDPSAARLALQALNSAPWLVPSSAEEILAAAGGTSALVVDPPATLGATPASPTTPAGGSRPVRRPGAPAATSDSPLTSDTAATLRALERGVQAVRTVTSPEIALEGRSPAALLSSTRWRGHAAAWGEARDALTTQVDVLRGGVQVVPSTVNFFAEHGVLQVTVTNELPVEVHDVHLLASTPQGRTSRLRIKSQPAPLRIRPNSRTTVRLSVEAVAAGVVPVTTSVRTSTGQLLGPEATVKVRVQPTNGWIVLAVGGVAGAIFVVGLFRAIRAGQRRVSEAELARVQVD